MKEYNYKEIGQLCQQFRKKYIKKSLVEAGKEIGVSKQSVSMFENGNSRSLKVFLWYIYNGLDILGNTGELTDDKRKQSNERMDDTRIKKIYQRGDP